MADHFDRIDDDLLLLVFNKLADIKALARCCAVSRRFYALAPHVGNVVVKVDCVITGEESSLNVKGKGILNLMRFVAGSLFKPLHTLQHLLGPKKAVVATQVSHHSPGEVLKNFREIENLRIELPERELGIEDGALLKWKAEFGRTLESCVILGAVSVVKSSGLVGVNGGTDTATSQKDDSGSIPELFYTNGDLKLRVVWTISSLIAASARHYLLHQIISEHPTLDSLVLTDADGQGLLCMGKEQLREFRDTPLAVSGSSNRTQVPRLTVKLWYAPYLEVPEGPALKGATLVAIRPTDQSGAHEVEGFLDGAFEEPYQTAAGILAKGRTYLLEMNSF